MLRRISHTDRFDVGTLNTVPTALAILATVMSYFNRPMRQILLKYAAGCLRWFLLISEVA